MDIRSLKAEKRYHQIFELHDELFFEASSHVCFDDNEFLGDIGCDIRSNCRECWCGSLWAQKEEYGLEG